MNKEVSRRQMMQLGLSAAATAGLAAAAQIATAQTAAATIQGAPVNASEGEAVQSSIKKAFLFLNQMMDAYAQGPTVRMCQSYSDQIAGGTFFSTAFVYDNALLILAYLSRRRGSDLARARILGDALLYAQQHDPAGDGRFRQAYMAGLPSSDGVYVTTGLSFFQGSAMGDVAWPAIALAQLHVATGSQAYLEGAVMAATFIETTARDNVNVPPGGYYFGNGQTNKSTEHNIDIFALFTMLAQLTGNTSWLDGVNHARAFVQAMFDAPSGHFWTGTKDATQIFYDNSPEDVQTWSYLAMKDPDYSISIDWVKTNLATTDTSFAFNNGWGNNGLKIRVNGMTFASLSKLGPVLGDSTVDPDAVWVEGTGHLLSALLQRRLPPGQDIPTFHGDVQLAAQLIESMILVQNTQGLTPGTLSYGQTVHGAPLVSGQGLPASTSILNTGFNFNYFPYFHIGATAWYVMGAQGYNPLRLSRS